jgi:hypothetical protein
LIEAAPPCSWRALQQAVARILVECGLSADCEVQVETVRGFVELDVVAVDESQPPARIAIECKQWERRVPKTVVHSFRTVISDAGFNTGIIVSQSGFQAGTFEAARHSNLHLLDWAQFEAMFEDRWFAQHMAPALRTSVDPLLEYTEPINSRIFRKADALSEQGRQRFVDLREKYFSLAWGFRPLMDGLPGVTEGPVRPTLPLRPTFEKSATPELMDHVPESILDVVALRPLMAGLLDAFVTAIGEFDEVFGERA